MPSYFLERPFLTSRELGALAGDLDRIFYETSARTTFASDDETRVFHDRWIGRYLRHFPELCFVARDEVGDVVGYLVGALEDPALSPLFQDDAVLRSLAQVTARYPAHLHVNLTERARGQGIGAALVSAFCDVAREAGAPGVHVMTARGMRNVRFYEAQGFLERAVVVRGERELLFLGRDLL